MLCQILGLPGKEAAVMGIDAVVAFVVYKEKIGHFVARDTCFLQGNL